MASAGENDQPGLGNTSNIPNARRELRSRFLFFHWTATMRLQSVYDSDPDWRRDPKTKFYCFRCQKDLKPGQPHRWIHVIDMNFILHPGDENTTGKESAWYPVGIDCAKRIGIEWTHTTPATAQGE